MYMLTYKQVLTKWNSILSIIIYKCDTSTAYLSFITMLTGFLVELFWYLRILEITIGHKTIRMIKTQTLFIVCLFRFMYSYIHILIHKNFRVEASKAGHKVDTCPETKDLWESRAASESASCGGVSEYHCLRDKDGKKRELCLEKTRILQGRNTKIKRVRYFHYWN